MSDIIYTPPASSGGGGQNPSQYFIPLNNGTSNFVDSDIRNDLGINIQTSVFGWNIDLSTKLGYFGDYNESFNGTQFILNDSINLIRTKNLGFDNGLKLDFSNRTYFFGDFNSINSGTSFFIDDASSTMYTKHSAQQEGLFFDFVNDYFQIGDFGYTNNGTFLKIDDDNQSIASYTNGNLKGLKLGFSVDQYSLGDFNGLSNGNYIIVDNTGNNEVVICANTQLNIKGANIQVNNIYTYSTENLQIKAPDGNIYYIPLYN